MKTMLRLSLLLSILALPLAVAAQSPASDSAVKSAENVYVGDGLVYYSLRDNKAVESDARTKTNWDILINGVEIHANRAGLILDAPFDKVTESPLEGMKTGIMKTADGGTWYNYDMNEHVITPKENKTFVLQLPDDTYAKIEVLSYYNRITDEPRYLSFRYVLQPDGSLAFPN